LGLVGDYTGQQMSRRCQDTGLSLKKEKITTPVSGLRLPQDGGKDNELILWRYKRMKVGKL
jgi:hypothetical protein